MGIRDWWNAKTASWKRRAAEEQLRRVSAERLAGRIRESANYVRPDFFSPMDDFYRSRMDRMFPMQATSAGLKTGAAYPFFHSEQEL